jgi:predicted cupin superfamily sugar epimerase
VYGNITQVQGNVQSTTCGQASGAGTLPFVIVPAGNYTCSFVARSTSCDTTVHDTVTAGAVDEDGVPFTPSDDATVVIKVTKP